MLRVWLQWIKNFTMTSWRYSWLHADSITPCLLPGSVRLQVREDGSEVAGHSEQDVLLPARHVPTGQQGTGTKQVPVSSSEDNVRS